MSYVIIAEITVKYYRIDVWWEGTYDCKQCDLSLSFQFNAYYYYLYTELQTLYFSRNKTIEATICQIVFGTSIVSRNTIIIWIIRCILTRFCFQFRRHGIQEKKWARTLSMKRDKKSCAIKQWMVQWSWKEVKWEKKYETVTASKFIIIYCCFGERARTSSFHSLNGIGIVFGPRIVFKFNVMKIREQNFCKTHEKTTWFDI